MRLFGFLRRKDSTAQRTPATVIRDALARKGMHVALPVIERKLDEVQRGEMQVSPALPEQLCDSDSAIARLRYTGTAYEVDISWSLADGAGQVSPGAMATIVSLATYYAVASELARQAGRPNYGLKAGESIGLCDFHKAPRHPIHQLFPELLSKTAYV